MLARCPFKRQRVRADCSGMMVSLQQRGDGALVDGCQQFMAVGEPPPVTEEGTGTVWYGGRMRVYTTIVIGQYLLTLLS